MAVGQIVDEEAKISLDPITMAVLSSRLDEICRDMANTLLRTARSTVIAIARDFSCGIVSADNVLLASAEGVPIHVIGMESLAETMTDEVQHFEEGDAFLHNDSYRGNSHQADHTIIVPVFWEGEHVFTVCAKAHQADIGNGQPSTYMPSARDVYEEGALTFPCVKVQEEYRELSDIIRICRARIRVPDQWYGDHLAAVGAARTGERALHALCKEYGIETVKRFISEWLDYSERSMAAEIAQLPEARLEGISSHDAFPGAPNAVPIRVSVEVDPDERRIAVNLRDNPDCLPNGLNLTSSTAQASAIAGVFNCIAPNVPANGGSARRITVHLREGCCVGIPRWPHSCSLATSNLAEHVVNAMQLAFSGLGPEYGMAEGAVGQGGILPVVSGDDARHDDEPYITQLLQGAAGGPGTPFCDGWLTYWLPVAAGLFYKDSIEVTEEKYPLIFDCLELATDSAGSGMHRGAPGVELVYGARYSPVTIAFFVDGHVSPPQGCRGGGGASQANTWVLEDGERKELDKVATIDISGDRRLVARSNGGGGFGDPRLRPPELVLEDVIEGIVSPEKAEREYAVTVVPSADPRQPFQIYNASTEALRSQDPPSEPSQTADQK